MTNPMIKIHDLATGEEIIREMDADELKQWEIDNANNLQIEAERSAEQSAKKAAQEKLTALGLTIEELKALGLWHFHKAQSRV